MASPQCTFAAVTGRSARHRPLTGSTATGPLGPVTLVVTLTLPLGHCCVLPVTRIVPGSDCPGWTMPLTDSIVTWHGIAGSVNPPERPLSKCTRSAAAALKNEAVCRDALA